MLDVQELYFTARSAIEYCTSTPERLTGLWTKLEAAVMNLRKLQWHLTTTKPCAEDILAPLVQILSTIEIRIGKVIEQYSCLIPFLSERLCYRAPVTLTEWVGRPSFVITKEQLEVMRSYGLSWAEIARALGKPKINSIIKKMFTRSHSYFFFVMPLFSRMELFSFLLIHILKRFWTSIRQLGSS